MATGYEDSRLETQVDQSLHCVICTEVLKDPETAKIAVDSRYVPRQFFTAIAVD
jgi:hypothetical protein